MNWEWFVAGLVAGFFGAVGYAFGGWLGAWWDRRQARLTDEANARKQPARKGPGCGKGRSA